MIARLLIALYPLGWRRRYGDELAALLRDTGVGPRVAIDLLAGALAAHARPRPGPSALVTPAERMRDTVGAVAVCWGAVVLAGAGFAKETEDAGYRTAVVAHPLLGDLRLVVAVLASGGAATMALAGVPLLVWVVGLAWRERPPGLVRLLALPPGVLAGFAAVTALLVALAPAARPLAVLWLGLGVITGAVWALAPRLVLARVKAPTPLLRWAARCAPALVLFMAALAVAVGVYAVALLVDAPDLARESGGPVWPTTFVAVSAAAGICVVASALAAISARRGYRIARG